MTLLSATRTAAILLLLTGCPAFAVDQSGLAAHYPDDLGIERDPAVLFADNFESGNLKRWDDIHGSIVVTNSSPNRGHYCAELEMVRGRNTGGDVKTGYDLR